MYVGEIICTKIKIGIILYWFRPKAKPMSKSLDKLGLNPFEEVG